MSYNGTAGLPLAPQVAGFGDTVVAEPLPTAQIDAIYGVLSTDVETLLSGTGTVSGSDSKLIASTGAGANAYAIVRSQRSLRYRPGQTVRARFAGFFTTGIASSLQLLGLASDENALGFAYNGADFGVLRRTGGLLEIRQATVTVAAAGGENVTVTLDGVAFGPIPVTAGTVQHNAFEIATWAGWAGTAWAAYQNDDTITFVADVVGDRSGAYSVSSTGALTATFAQLQAGASNTDQFIAQADWDKRPFEGFDPTMGNVYEVIFQWLGYGDLAFRIINPSTGQYETVHTIQYPNTATTPSLLNPAMNLSAIAQSLGSTSDLQVALSSMGAFVDGYRIPFRNPRGYLAEASGVGNTLTNVFTIRNSPVFNNKVNVDEILPQLVAFVSGAASGATPVQFYAVINATVAGEPNWQWIEVGQSRVEVDVAGTTVTGGRTLVAIGAAASGTSPQIDLRDLQTRLLPGDTLTLAALRTSGTTDVTASLTWTED